MHCEHNTRIIKQLNIKKNKNKLQTIQTLHTQQITATNVTNRNATMHQTKQSVLQLHEMEGIGRNKLKW